MSHDARARNSPARPPVSASWRAGEEPVHEELLAQQAALAEFGEFALRTDDLDPILNEACRLVGRALGTDLAKVMERQADGRTLLVRAGVGWEPGVVGRLEITTEEDTSTAHALATGEPCILPDLAREERFRIAGFVVEHGVKALANVPIRGVGRQAALRHPRGRQPRAAPVHRDRHRLPAHLRQPAGRGDRARPHPARAALGGGRQGAAAAGAAAPGQEQPADGHQPRPPAGAPLQERGGPARAARGRPPDRDAEPGVREALRRRRGRARGPGHLPRRAGRDPAAAARRGGAGGAPVRPRSRAWWRRWTRRCRSG